MLSTHDQENAHFFYASKKKLSIFPINHLMPLRHLPHTNPLMLKTKKISASLNKLTKLKAYLLVIIDKKSSCLNINVQEFFPYKLARTPGTPLRENRRLGHSTCRTKHSTCKTRHSTCKTRNSTCKTRHSTCKTRHSTCKTKHSTCKTRDSTCKTRQSTWKAWAQYVQD